MSSRHRVPHPNSPAGGGGPGGFRGAVPLGTDGPESGGVQELSLLNISLAPLSAADPSWAKEPAPAYHPVLAVKTSSGWADLRAFAERVLGPESFDLGVCVGLVENLASGVSSLFGLLKTLVLEGVYEQVHHPSPGWASAISPGYLGARAFALLAGDHELESAHEQCSAILEELKRIIADPSKFLRAAGQKYQNEYAAKWSEFKEQIGKRTLLGDYHAGRITGQLLLDVLMILLSVAGAAEMAAKLAGEIPELLNVAQGLRGAKEAIQLERASAAAAGAEEVEAGEAASAAPEPEPAAEPPVKGLDYQPSSGAKLVADPDKTTTVLGNYQRDMKPILQELGNKKSVDFGPKPGDFNALNVPDPIADNLTPQQFWDQYNKPFLDQAMSRGDNIVLATKPDPTLLAKANGDLTGFGREMQYLQQNGYHYDPARSIMVK